MTAAAKRIYNTILNMTQCCHAVAVAAGQPFEMYGNYSDRDEHTRSYIYVYETGTKRAAEKNVEIENANLLRIHSYVC